MTRARCDLKVPSSASPRSPNGRSSFEESVMEWTEWSKRALNRFASQDPDGPGDHRPTSGIGSLHSFKLRRGIEGILNANGDSKGSG